jgi:plastocyanin
MFGLPLRLGRPGISRQVGTFVLLGAVVAASIAYVDYAGPRTGVLLQAGISILPQVPLASADVTANYTVALDVAGSSGSYLRLGATVPEGLQATFTPDLVQGGEGTRSVMLSLRASGSLPPGMYRFNVTLTSGNAAYSKEFAVDVVRYLVATDDAAPAFVPANMTVPAGSTVYWIRLNGGFGFYDNGQHKVVFRTIDADSPILEQFQSWNYTFTQDGTFSYYCDFHQFMTGEVVVG